ncbi:MAG: hypothetical protein E6K69_03360 [Nitrospirae bacterium]|nr:MAG: hypothetical protein E6K69_03360 [Nitrospirota bacterium]
MKKRDHVTIRLNLPLSIWQAYKGLCIARGMQVAEPLLLFMQQEIKKWYAQNPETHHGDTP